MIELFQFFQVRIHPTLHVYKTGSCQVEFVSLTFNMMSSNTDMSTSRRKDLEELRRTLTKLDREPSADSQEVAILCSNDDGLFTNAEGVAEFFSKFKRITIVLYIFLGGAKWEKSGMNDLTAAIADFRAKDYTNLTPSHHLLLKWVGISINKEMLVLDSSRTFKSLPDTGLPKQSATLGLRCHKTGTHPSSTSSPFKKLLSRPYVSIPLKLSRNVMAWFDTTSRLATVATCV